jgi:hypothetical protein
MITQCPNCGNDVPLGNKPCPFCGTFVPAKFSGKKFRTKFIVILIVLIIIWTTFLTALIFSSVSSPPSKDWWTDYPDGHLEADQDVPHPIWITDELDDHDAVLIFFWQVGCGPCEQQWDEMDDDGLVKGSIEDGSMDRYSDRALLLSLDINSQDNYKSALHVYDPYGSNYGTPTTVIITKLSDDEIGWYSYKGIMNVDDLDEYIDNAVNYKGSLILSLILNTAVIGVMIVIVILVIYLVIKSREGEKI